MRRLAVLTAVASAALPAVAHGAVVASPPATLGAAVEAPPRLVLAPDGAATAAWAAPSGLVVARRGPGGAWAAPDVAAGLFRGPVLAAGADGGVDVAATRFQGSTPEAVVVRDAAPGRAPGPADPVPGLAGEGIEATSVARLADGTVLAGALRHEPTGTATEVLVAERDAKGTWSAPVALSTHGGRGPYLAVAAGRAVALWSAVGPGSTVARMWVAERSGPGTWSAPQAISGPDRVAEHGYATPSLTANARGDILAVWNSGPGPAATGGFVPPFPDAVEAVLRPAGRQEWPAPTLLAASNATSARPTGALAPDGSAVLAWTAGAWIASAVAPPGGPVGPMLVGSEPGDGVDAAPLTLDARGRAVTARMWGVGQQPVRLRLLGQEPGGCFTGQASLSVPGARVAGSALAVTPAGDGVVAWTELVGGAWTVRTADVRQDGTGGPSCPDGQGTGAVPLPPPPPVLALGGTAPAIERRALLRRGLKVAVAPDRAARVAVALTGVRRRAGTPVVVAVRDLGVVRGRRVVRLRGGKGRLARTRRDRALTLWATASADGAVTTVKRRVRVSGR